MRFLLIASLTWIGSTTFAGQPAGGQVPADVQPEFTLPGANGRSLQLGLDARIWAIPYLGSDAALENGDPANGIGWRAHSAKIGMLARLSPKAEVIAVIDPLAAGDSLADLRFRYRWRPALTLGFGTSEVPYFASHLLTANHQKFAGHALSTGELAVGERLGVTLEGRHYRGKLEWILGVYNGSESSQGNDGGGLMEAFRLAVQPLGDLAERVPTGFKYRLGVGGVYGSGPSVDTLAYSVDLSLEGKGWKLRGEFLKDARNPQAEPSLPVTLVGSVERQVTLAEVSGFVVGRWLEVALRVEQYDDNLVVEDFGDQLIVTGGLNAYGLGGTLRSQLNYIHRREQAGTVELDNDSIVLSLATSF